MSRTHRRGYWVDANATQIKFNKFLVSKFLRSSMTTLLQRISGESVHVFLPADKVVPSLFDLGLSQPVLHVDGYGCAFAHVQKQKPKPTETHEPHKITNTTNTTNNTNTTNTPQTNITTHSKQQNTNKQHSYTRHKNTIKHKCNR